jgi:thiamine-monophosphate kinase
MTASLEVTLIERLARGFPRHPQQLNARHESDAELVRLPGGVVLAVTTDGVVEEIDAGLYDDPELAGWMVVTVNASDLAAVGARPLGIVVCETLPRHAEPGMVDALQAGIRAAAVAYHLPVLGGDTNVSERMHVAATALGIVEGTPLTRRGAAPGDVLFATAPLGAGSAFALARLSGRPAPAFRPIARLPEGSLLRPFASACMDSSDGVLATLHELGRLNQVGFQVSRSLADVLDGAALAAARAAGLPPWTLLAGPHGEFELIFTVPAARVRALRRAAADAGWVPLELGMVTEGAAVRLGCGDGELTLDAGRVRNLFEECGGDVPRYIEGLLKLAAGDGGRA